MALSARNQITYQNHEHISSATPRVIEFEILLFLSISDLDQAMLVSRYWHALINDDGLWANTLREINPLEMKKIQERLLIAVRFNKLNFVYRYIRRGAPAEYKWDGVIVKNNILDSDIFNKPNLLTIAANYTHGIEGARVIQFLLAHGANPLIQHQYLDSIPDSDIKAMIALVQFEHHLVTRNHYDYIALTQACDTESIFIKDYLSALKIANQDFIGVQHIIPIDKISTLHNHPRFLELHSETFSPSFFSRYWRRLALTLAATYLYLMVKTEIMFGTTATALGTKIMSLCTAKILPSIIYASIGFMVISLIIGAIIIGCSLLINAIEKNRNKANLVHFPIKLENTSKVSAYSGSLFSNHCFSINARVNKKIVAEMDDRRLLKHGRMQ